jgi:uncharacterized protein (DUF433 family)
VDDDPLELISIDPAVCHGQPCVNGTRVMVTVVLHHIAFGKPEEGLLGRRPALGQDDSYARSYLAAAEALERLGQAGGRSLEIEPPSRSVELSL